MLQLPAAFDGLRPYKQFVIQRAILMPDGSTKKEPLHPEHHYPHSAFDESLWLDADEAVALAASLETNVGIGFVLTAEDPFFFLDIDHAFVNGEWSLIAQELINQFQGAAVETGVSGDGLHIVGIGSDVIPDNARKRMTTLGLELYKQKRIIRISGLNSHGDCECDCSLQLIDLVPKYFPIKEVAALVPWSDVPRADWSGPVDDVALINKMLATVSSGSVFNENGVTFRDLWEGNDEALGKRYPADKPHDPYNRSGVDGALSKILAFWTGCHHSRIDRIMRASIHVRDKWDDHPNYWRDTIDSACSEQDKVYSDQYGKDFLIEEPKRPKPTMPAIPPTKAELNGLSNGATGVPPVPMDEVIPTGDKRYKGWSFVAVTDQLHFFKDCVYVNDQHKILLHNGMFVGPDQFRARFGGSTFALDGQGTNSTDNAWKCFTESQAINFDKCDSLTFRPNLPPNEMITEETIVSVNTYRPVNAPCIEGDVSKFHHHLQKILPDERDRNILLYYMAACVQHLGHKFQWAPLIQGVEGNGKTLFTRCVAYCVGKRYTHWPKADDLDSKFNFWLLENAFIGVEDIYVPESRGQIIETLKPMITGDQLEIQGKGDNQISKEICANFILNSNHKNAIRKTKNDRRFCVFYTAQQHESDLERDGMGGDYFPDLYDWLKAGGYAAVHHMLKNLVIPIEFNPALQCGGKAHRAPKTSTTNQVIEASMGGIEQEILEAIQEERPGFCGGWVSSLALDKLLTELRAQSKLPRTKRREIMQQLGYDHHPALEGGRVTKVIPIDQGRPQLFCKVSEPMLMGLAAGEVAREYVDAQQGKGMDLGGSIFDRFPVDLGDNKAIVRS